MFVAALITGPLLVTSLAVAGVAWSDCVLLAGAVLAGQRLFLWRMDRGAPWDAWRAALRCLGAGLLGLAAAVALGVVVSGCLLGLWDMRHANPLAALMLIGLGAFAMLLLQSDAAGRRAEALAWAVPLAGAALVFDLSQAGPSPLACWVAVGLAAGLVWTNWRLARRSAGELLHQQRRVG